jgi:hypothetical protein
MTSESINQPLQSDVHFNAKTKFWNCAAQSQKQTERIAPRMLPLMLMPKIGGGGSFSKSCLHEPLVALVF